MMVENTLFEVVSASSVLDDRLDVDIAGAVRCRRLHLGEEKNGHAARVLIQTLDYSKKMETGLEPGENWRIVKNP